MSGEAIDTSTRSIRRGSGARLARCCIAAIGGGPLPRPRGGILFGRTSREGSLLGADLSDAGQLILEAYGTTLEYSSPAPAL
jgi:hypothetical protein